MAKMRTERTRRVSYFRVSTVEQAEKELSLTRSGTLRRSSRRATMPSSATTASMDSGPRERLLPRTFTSMEMVLLREG